MLLALMSRHLNIILRQNTPVNDTVSALPELPPLIKIIRRFL
ncbi:hypothetical protein HanXRQr2_Chr15g0691861 [Helianthus annuus]|uniref:Uncharacterized protein n=1 Tax=Helianthus annuus TaxID=4232 RepID=A0A9K3DZZ7_HELAN|nr:hypothetical protein HanXRQr2_Chr15g0691861 [Helianthus annuus]KAJ0831150.1 hypothetical protein HanPSC8_Chr15g0663701 [Helianthus annuus]